MGTKDLVGNRGGSDKSQLLCGISSRVHGSVRNAVEFIWVFMPQDIVGMDENSWRDVLLPRMVALLVLGLVGLNSGSGVVASIP